MVLTLTRAAGVGGCALLVRVSLLEAVEAYDCEALLPVQLLEVVARVELVLRLAMCTFVQRC